MSIKLCSLTDLKDFLEVTTENFDGVLDLLVTSIGSQFETYTNRKFALTAIDEYRNAGETYYYVNSYPILEGSVTVTYNSEIQEEDEDYYVWYDKGYIEFESVPARTKPKQIRLQYTGGYPEDSEGILSIEDDIQYACMLQCAFIFKRRRELGVTKVTLPDGAIGGMKTAELLPDVKTILSSYRNTAH